MSAFSDVYDLIVIGGGAAGFFGAIRVGEEVLQARILLLEQGQQVLGKVKISGGGRCNVTHACFDPSDLCHYYPRGEKELLGPFHRFAAGDTVAWFSDQGIHLKTEEDGRMFPITNTSQTIIDCFQKKSRALGIQTQTGSRADALRFLATSQLWEVKIKGEKVLAKTVLATPGSSKRFWALLQNLGHTIIDPVPSLFTFNIPDKQLHRLAGTTVQQGQIRIPGAEFEEEGPILITHWGLSGPAILKLSSLAARALHQKKYRFSIQVNWIGEPLGACLVALGREKASNPRRKVAARPLLGTTQRLWRYLLGRIQLGEQLSWAEISKKQLQALAQELVGCRHEVTGKSTFKEEFVTAGGVDLKEVDLRRFESKLCPGLFLAGEVLDIDALTGGFNFQAAWTGSWIAGSAIAEQINIKKESRA